MFLGLLPWQTRRLNPVEMEALLRGWQWRFNRDARVTAWFLAVLRPLMAHAVAEGIARGLWNENPRPKPIDVRDLLKTMPGYEEDAE